MRSITSLARCGRAREGAGRLSLLAALALACLAPSAAQAEEEAAAAAPAPAAEAEEASTPPVSLIASVRYQQTVSVAQGAIPTKALLGGVEWRVRAADWVQIGGGFWGGRDVTGDFPEGLVSLRVEVVGAQFEAPASAVAKPYLRAALGWQGETLAGGTVRDARQEVTAHTGDGFLFSLNPGLLLLPCEHFQIHLEYQVSVYQGGNPEGGATVQMGGGLGLGAVF